MAPPHSPVASHVGFGERAEYRFGLVLLLLIATFTFMASAPTGAWTRAVLVVLQSATLLAALSAAAAPRRIVRLAILVVAFALVATAATSSIDGTQPAGFVALLNALLVGLAPVAIAWSIVRRRVIDVQTMLGALCIYVLLGMFWAFLFSAIGTFGSHPFFVQQASTSSADYLYFAFVTQTTVGYGDLTAGGNLGRALAALDGLLGQIYLVTVIALIVSNMVQGGRASLMRDEPER